MVVVVVVVVDMVVMDMVVVVVVDDAEHSLQFEEVCGQEACLRCHMVQGWASEGP